MNKLKVHYPDTKSHPELSEEDIAVLRKFEPEVLRALPTLFCVMVDAAWIHISGHTGKYFQLVARTNPQKTIGDFGLKFLQAQSREVFYGKLEEAMMTAPDFKKQPAQMAMKR